MPTISITLTQIQVDALELFHKAALNSVMQELAERALGEMRMERRRELEAEISAANPALLDVAIIAEFRRRAEP